MICSHCWFYTLICLSGSHESLYFSALQVVVAKEAVGNLGGMVRQLSLDQFENESRRMVPSHNDLSNPTKKFARQRSPQGLHKKASFTRFIFSCGVFCFFENKNLMTY